MKPAGVSNGMQENGPRWKLQPFFTQLLMAHNCSHTGATIETQSLAAGLLLFFKSLQVQVLVSWLLAGSKTMDSRELSNAAEDNSFEPIHFLPTQNCLTRTEISFFLQDWFYWEGEWGVGGDSSALAAGDGCISGTSDKLEARSWLTEIRLCTPTGNVEC